MMYLLRTLKRYTSKETTLETRPLTRTEIFNKLKQDYPGEEITEKMVRTRLDAMIESEACLPENEKTVFYETYHVKGKRGSKIQEERHTNFYYNNNISDVELKYLVDSIMYGKIFNSKQAEDFAKRVQDLSGKSLVNITPYANSSFGKQRFTLETSVLKNIEEILKAMQEQKYISFDWYVYDVENGKVILHFLNRRIAKPMKLILNDGRYFVLVHYLNSAKVYTYSVDLMKNIESENLHDDKLKKEELQDNFERAKYILQRPYNFGGEIKTYKLRVNRELFSRLVNTFSYEIYVLRGTETKDTVDIRVHASEKGMMYWLLHHYDVAELIDNDDEELEKDLKNAVEKLYKRYHS